MRLMWYKKYPADVDSEAAGRERMPIKMFPRNKEELREKVRLLPAVEWGGEEGCWNNKSVSGSQWARGSYQHLVSAPAVAPQSITESAGSE
jgi:hypothetical protein